MTNKTYHHGDLKAKLVSAAISLLKEEGIQGFNLRKLGKSIGVSPMAAYRHFKNKEDLLQNIAAQGFEQLTQQLLEVKFENLQEKLVEQGVSFVRFANDNPQHYQLMFSSSELGEWSDALSQISQIALSVMSETVAELIKQESKQDTLDAMQITLICWSNVHGVAEFFSTGKVPSSLNYEEFTRSSCTYLVRGIF